LSFTPVVAAFTVELMSKAFASLPDRILMPWLPQLLRGLRAHATTGGALAILMKEAAAIFPKDLAALEKWEAPWEKAATTPDPKASRPQKSPRASERNTPCPSLVRTHPATTEALARMLGFDVLWTKSDDDHDENAAPDATASAVPKLLSRYPATANAWAAMLK
jgi:hypothetical protein